MKWNLYIVLICLICCAEVSAQDSTDVRALEINWANDMWNGHDRYYSNGMELRLTAPGLRYSPIYFMKIPFFKDSQETYALEIQQHMFTPRERFSPTPVQGDRPFASYLRLRNIHMEYNPERRMKVESTFYLGFMGPASGGVNVQNGIHGLLPTSDIILGWENQIANDICLSYALQVEKGFNARPWFEFYLQAGTELGMPYTFVEAGSGFRVGIFENVYAPLHQVKQRRNWEAYFYASGKMRYVFYNATLQGGLIGDSVYTLEEINHALPVLHIGIRTSYKRYFMEAGEELMGAEFSGANRHAYGFIRFGFNF